MSLWRSLTALFRREPHRPLAYRQPQLRERDVPLGMEATNMDVVDAASRRNQSLERSAKLGSFGNYAETPIRAFKDDETYAKQYHRLYDKKK